MRVSIKEIVKKCKSFFGSADNKDFFVIIIIILSSLASFGLGRLSKIEENKMPVIIENAVSNSASVIMSDPSSRGFGAVTPLAQTGGGYVASKNGAKYYLPWCGGAQKISEKNKITFSSKEEAAKAGYAPAANCKGI